MEKIKIKNVSSSTVVISARDLDIRRKLIPGRTVLLEKDVVEELAYDPGFNNLVKAGYIAIIADTKEAKQYISEVLPDAKEQVITEKDIEAILNSRNIQELIKILKDATQATKESVVKIATSKKITDGGIAALIKKYCGVDVVQAISFSSQVEE